MGEGGGGVERQRHSSVRFPFNIIISAAHSCVGNLDQRTSTRESEVCASCRTRHLFWLLKTKTKKREEKERKKERKCAFCQNFP